MTDDEVIENLRKAISAHEAAKARQADTPETYNACVLAEKALKIDLETLGGRGTGSGIHVQLANGATAASSGPLQPVVSDCFRAVQCIEIAQVGCAVCNCLR